MFVGHDHINNYVGNFHGVLLGYGASTGFGPYGFRGNEMHRLRGVRVHDFIEDNVRSYVTNFSTYFKRAGNDYGMCMAPDPASCNGNAYYPWTPQQLTPNVGFAATEKTQSANDKLTQELKPQRDGSWRAVGGAVNKQR